MFLFSLSNIHECERKKLWFILRKLVSTIILNEYIFIIEQLVTEINNYQI